MFSLPAKVRARFDEMLLTSRDAVAMSALAPLDGPFLPITSYSMRPSGILTLVNDVVINRRRSIVEFGPGLSTIYLARMLRSLGDGGHITSFDHDAGWLTVLQRQLALESLTEFVTLVHAPLKPGRWEFGAGEWYDEQVVASRVPASIDLLIVDGPPAYERARQHARFPALDAVRARLAQACTIALDDGQRSGERAIAERWILSLGEGIRQQGGRTIILIRGQAHDV